MSKAEIYPVMQAVLAAALFGISTPLAKVLLGSVPPVTLASLLYLGSGVGLTLLLLLRRLVGKRQKSEASLTRKDAPWLAGAIVFGGVLAPIISMVSLRGTPASTASLLLNFESVATTLIALLAFKENIGKRVAFAVALITLSSVVLSWDFSNRWGFSLGALGIILACVCWGIDNNLTRSISSKNPYSIVAVKGLGAGLFSLCLSLASGNRLPDLRIALLAMLLGFFSYGLSIVLFVLAMRNLGSARTSAFFGAAPFIGALLSFVVFGSIPDLMFIIALPIMLFGTILLLKDNHAHYHAHEPVVHEHKHTHNDGHHNHAHEDIPGFENISHSHVHGHNALLHRHAHTPDINHRHVHTKKIGSR
jgi:drug/metabolite transporter (DMT)-like permease